jgi:hypothetical protein
VSQHTEAVRVSLTVADSEIFIAAQHNAPSAFAAIKKACHLLAAAAKRVGIRRALSAMMIAGATLGASTSGAAVVTTTVTGTVSSGKDSTGVFGFAPGSSLTGQSFKLVFTFDDTKGTQSIREDSQGTRCGSGITNYNTNPPGPNPGTVVLQIGNGSWTFGTLSGFNHASSVTRSVGNCGDSLDYQVQDESTTGVGGDDVFSLIVPATGAVITTDYNWEDALSDSQLGNQPINFTIELSQLATPAVATGVLTPTSVTVSGPSSQPNTTALQFVPVTPCRVADTRNATGPFGGPEVAAGTSREFDIPQSACGIPSGALAYSLNVTAVPSGPLGYLTLWPSGQAQPTVSTLNSDGRAKANAAITPAGTNGGVSIFVTNPTHVVLDINGYFVPAGSSSALSFYSLSPCRVLDTRKTAGPLGGPSLAGNSSRSFDLQQSVCGFPYYAKAYSLNVTVIPKTSLGYLTMWPTGETQPLVSTLNATTGAVTANAAIVPVGNNGGISIFVSDDSDVVVDANGYFAVPAADGSELGLSFYPAAPCRGLDTRNSSGAFNGLLSVVFEDSPCAPSSAAQAYVLNATVVPTSSLGYLTLWPAGGTQPVVSTLNANDGAVSSNMAILPTVNGDTSAFSSNSTQLILDISGYFAP